MHITVRKIQKTEHRVNCDDCYDYEEATYEVEIKLVIRTVVIWLCDNHLMAFSAQAGVLSSVLEGGK